MKVLPLLLLCAVTACGTTARTAVKAAPPLISVAEIQRASTIADSAKHAYDSKRYRESAEKYERAAVIANYPGTASAWYNAACSWALAGEKQRAIGALQHAVDQGWRNAGHLKVDSDLDSLHGTTEWQRIVAQAEKAETDYAEKHANPDNVKLVTSDITNFWRAYDLAAAETSYVAKRSIFQREYIGRASPGLLDYYFSKIRGLDNLTRFVTKQSRYYDSVRPQTMRATDVAAEIRAAMHRLKDLYPDATFPDVYFVIGVLSSGGTASQNGMLIGTEMYSTTPSTPVDELAPGIARIVNTADALPNTVIHELVHFLQRGGNQTLLSQSIREGSAVYLAQLVQPLAKPAYFMMWGAAHEAAVRERFLREKESTDWSQWLGNNGSASEDWPADLGYFIGYRIAEEYVKHSADRKQAISDLLIMKDPKEILAKSGYAQ